MAELLDHNPKIAAIVNSRWGPAPCLGRVEQRRTESLPQMRETSRPY